MMTDFCSLSFVKRPKIGLASSQGGLGCLIVNTSAWPWAVFLTLLIFVAGVFWHSPGQAGTLVAEVTQVSDGDTLWVKPTSGDSQAMKLRIQGIDAPELCQPYGRQARQSLTDWLLHKTVAVVTRGKDNYGRWLAQLNFKGEDVGRWMVKNGYAWSYRYENDPGIYAREQDTAQALKHGLWSSSTLALEPKIFRQKYNGCS